MTSTQDNNPQDSLLPTPESQSTHNASANMPLLNRVNTDKATHKPRYWPSSPRRVKSSIFAILSNALFDVALLAFSAAFLAFALIVNSYDQAPTGENPRATRMLDNATKYGPTVFPLLFATVIGRAAHLILLWRLEKGESIGILDTLAASTSLTSTFTSQFQLRMITLPGLLLIVVWILSPVGGQASIRQMSIEKALVTEPASFRYVASTGHIGAFQASDNMVIFNTVNALFTSAMLASWQTRISPVDTWGNIKIPQVERYEKRSKPDVEGWYNTSLEEKDVAAYTSFVGIPIDGNTANVAKTDYMMRIQTPYLYLQCSSVKVTSPGTPLPPNAMNTTGNGAYIWWWEDKQRNRSGSSVRSLKPFNFTYARLWGSNITIPCTMTSTYVETEISCIANSTCLPIRVRRSRLDSLSPAWTPFDIHWQLWWVFTKGFMSSFGKAEGTPGQPVIDKYLQDPHLHLNNHPDSLMNPVQAEPSNEEYSDRFGHVINSYFNCMNSIWSVTGGIDNHTSFISDDNNTFVPPLNPLASKDPTSYDYNLTSDRDKKSRVWSTRGTKSVHVEIIKAHKPWVTVLSIVSVALIISSLFSLVVRFFLIKGPDVAMNISSLATRNNPHVLVPAGGTFLDAGDRAKLLKDAKVCFGDVGSDDDIGSLAIGSCGVDKFRIVGVQRGRLYE